MVRYEEDTRKFENWKRQRERDLSSWRAQVQSLTDTALRTAVPLVLDPLRYFEASSRVAHSIAEFNSQPRWIQPESFLVVDCSGDWERLHYHCLRREHKHNGGRAAYSATLWWKEMREKQRKLASRCQRCQSPRDLETHHLHYSTVGAERLGIDLLTLCHNCHRLEEGFDPEPPPRPAGCP